MLNNRITIYKRILYSCMYYIDSSKELFAKSQMSENH